MGALIPSCLVMLFMRTRGVLPIRPRTFSYDLIGKSYIHGVYAQSTGEARETKIHVWRRESSSIAHCPLCVFAALREDCSMQDRIEVFKQMLDVDPENAVVMFGLAKEYEKQARYSDIIPLLESY